MQPRMDLWSDFFGSSASLQRIMNQLDNIDFPSIGSADFNNFWALDFGFAVIVSLVGTVASLYSYHKTRDLVVIINAFITLITTFIVGFLLPPTLYLLTWVSKKVSHYITLIPQGIQSKPTDPWYQIYSLFITGTQPVPAIANRIVGVMLSTILEGFVTSVITGLFLFAFLTLVAYPIRRIGFGFTFYRLGISGLVSTVFMQPLVLIVLAFGAVALKFSGTDVGSLNNSLSLILLVACLMPILLFFFVFRRTQTVQIEGPVATNGGNSNGFLGGISIGRADSRPYVGRIPQTGDTMEGVASKANWVAKKLSIASKALAVVAPEAVPVTAGLAVAASSVSQIQSNQATKGKHTTNEAAQAQPPSSTENGEIRTINGATVTTAADYNQVQSDQPEVQETSSQVAKPRVGTLIRQGASSAASGVSSAAIAVGKTARWSSGAQRKTQQMIDQQLKR